MKTLKLTFALIFTAVGLIVLVAFTAKLRAASCEDLCKAQKDTCMKGCSPANAKACVDSCLKGWEGCRKRCGQ
jgi:hypothetical protein